MPTLSAMPTPSTFSPMSGSESDFVERFRYTNSLYKRRALAFRSSLRLTSHARHRATFLNLHVDIQKAVRCDQRQVSNVPLPIIDTEPSPVELEWVHEDVQSVLLQSQSMPQSISSSVSSSSSSDDSFVDAYEDHMEIEQDVNNEVSIVRQSHAEAAAEIHRPHHRPALRCTIPTVSVNLVESPGSRFSPDSEYSAITLTSAQPSSIGPKGIQHYSSSPVGSESMVLQYPQFGANGVSIDFDEHDVKEYKHHQEQDEEEERQRMAAKHTILIPTRRHLQPLEVPSEAHRMSWGCGEMSEMDVTSSSSSASSSSSMSTEYGVFDSSSGLTTPEDVEPGPGHQNPLMIRITRSHKSTNFSAADYSGHCSDIADGDVITSTEFEKRPKFERKEWVHPYARRNYPAHLRTLPMRRQT